MAPKKTKAAPAEDAVGDERGRSPRQIKLVKPGRPGTKPQVQRLKLLGNQRLTPSGNVKRAKKRGPKSLKKGHA